MNDWDEDEPATGTQDPEAPDQDTGAAQPLYPGDTGELPLEARRLLVQLLSGPSLDGRRHGRLGVVSHDADSGFPRHVWALTKEGVVVEARCDDPQRGRYHGYPLEPHDPMGEMVRRRWKEAE